MASFSLWSFPPTCIVACSEATYAAKQDGVRISGKNLPPILPGLAHRMSHCRHASPIGGQAQHLAIQHLVDRLGVHGERDAPGFWLRRTEDLHVASVTAIPERHRLPPTRDPGRKTSDEPIEPVASGNADRLAEKIKEIGAASGCPMNNQFFFPRALGHFPLSDHHDGTQFALGRYAESTQEPQSRQRPVVPVTLQPHRSQGPFCHSQPPHCCLQGAQGPSCHSARSTQLLRHKREGIWADRCGDRHADR